MPQFVNIKQLIVVWKSWTAGGEASVCAFLCARVHGRLYVWSLTGLNTCQIGTNTASLSSAYVRTSVASYKNKKHTLLLFCCQCRRPSFCQQWMITGRRFSLWRFMTNQCVCDKSHNLFVTLANRSSKTSVFKLIEQTLKPQQPYVSFCCQLTLLIHLIQILQMYFISKLKCLHASVLMCSDQFAQ